MTTHIPPTGQPLGPEQTPPDDQPGSDDVLAHVSTGAMTRAQTVAVLVAIFLNVIDGFDVLVMAFTSTSVASYFDLAPDQLGWLLSAGPVGMAIGAIFIAPVADRIGRRPVTLAALVAVTVFMGLSAMATSAGMLGIMRFATGIGVGAMLPNLTTFVSEFSTARWREPAVTLNSLGYALGGLVGGAISVPLIASYGWRAAFWLGAGLGLVGLVATWRFVPESIHYLIGRRPDGALERVNGVLARIGRAPVTALPELTHQERARFRDMFRGSLGRTTILVWIAFFCLLAAFYFANSWTPKLLADSGLSEQQSIVGGVMISLGGVVGALAFALLAIRAPARLLEVGVLICGALSFVLFSFVLSSAIPALISAVLVGIFINAMVAGMYAVVVTRYPAAIRGAGVGWGVGFGRFGAILAPSIAGSLLAAGMEPRSLYFVFAVPMVIAAVAVLCIRSGVASDFAVAKPEGEPKGRGLAAS
ncbi:MFS transporter [Epidermidibacterium keratini]|uniref:MFS transporter n=1 Tax=Epidermidibacterium keratini TaxID=1891644 RepID=A0A7L4YQB3_9ACTN|nr:MFS transporter [Epidermidibacterium keratini]QHC01084.1 MFS transporter [Epidermidibacterium keratini]